MGTAFSTYPVFWGLIGALAGFSASAVPSEGSLAGITAGITAGIKGNGEFWIKPTPVQKSPGRLAMNINDTLDGLMLLPSACVAPPDSRKSDGQPCPEYLLSPGGLYPAPSGSQAQGVQGFEYKFRQQAGGEANTGASNSASGTTTDTSVNGTLSASSSAGRTSGTVLTPSVSPGVAEKEPPPGNPQDDSDSDDDIDINDIPLFGPDRLITPFQKQEEQTYRIMVLNFMAAQETMRKSPETMPPAKKHKCDTEESDYSETGEDSETEGSETEDSEAENPETEEGAENKEESEEEKITQAKLTRLAIVIWDEIQKSNDKDYAQPPTIEEQSRYQLERLLADLIESRASHVRIWNRYPSKVLALVTGLVSYFTRPDYSPGNFTNLLCKHQLFEVIEIWKKIQFQSGRGTEVENVLIPLTPELTKNLAKSMKDPLLVGLLWELKLTAIDEINASYSQSDAEVARWIFLKLKDAHPGQKFKYGFLASGLKKTANTICLKVLKNALEQQLRGDEIIQ